jgi:hypothetical protein
MKRVFLLIVVPALMVALGFAQTPAGSINTDQTVKGCLAGSDGSYTVVEDGTGQILKITTSTIDFKQHLGHDVALIGHRAGGTNSAAADSSFTVTALNMISEQCGAVAAAAPVATVGTPGGTPGTPDAAAAPAAAPAATAPAATMSTLPETTVAPSPDAASPAATASAPAETAVTPAAAAPDGAVAPPAETTVTPAADAPASIELSSTPSDTAGAPTADTARPTRMSRRQSARAAAAATTADATARPSSDTAETGSMPEATAATPARPSSQPVNTPDAAATPAAVPARHGALLLLIMLGVLIIVIGTLVPFLSRWRKRRTLERTDAPNLSFTREASSDKDKPEEPRHAA